MLDPITLAPVTGGTPPPAAADSPNYVVAYSAGNQSAIAHSDGCYVSTGSGGLVYRSTDLVKWTLAMTGITTTVSCVFHNGTEFVACYSNGIARSVDGISWTTATAPWTNTVYCSASSGSVWVVGDASGRIWSSPDTVTWTQRAYISSTVMTAATYANGQFLVGAGNGLLYISTDGFTWISKNISMSATVAGIAYSGSLYVVVGTGSGASTTSPDTVTWTSNATGLSNGFASLAYGGGLFVGGGQGTVNYYSDNGINWSPANLSSYGVASSVTWTGSEFVGSRVSGKNTLTLKTVTGATWTGVAHPVTVTLNYIRYLNSIFIGGNSTVIYYTTNAATWTMKLTSMAFNNMTFSNGYYIGVSTAGNTARSTDLASWTTVTTGLTSTFFGAVSNGSTVMLCGSGGGIAYSTNSGASYSIGSSGVTTGLREASYYNGVWIIVGDNGVLLSGGDPGVMIRRSLGGTTNLMRGVAYSSTLGRYVAVGSVASIFASTDAATWTAVTAPAGTTDLWSVVWTGSSFVAGGSTGCVIRSFDGLTWTRDAGRGSATVQMIATNGSKTVVASGSYVAYTP